jgi:uncharacterized LabA/DUF88 family protein
VVWYRAASNSGLGFSGDKGLRTAVYVDGFNLYYRALKGTRYRWLNLLALSQTMLKPENRVTLIRYFTARVNSTAADPDKHVRQDAYLKALSAAIPCLQVHEGSFLRNTVSMPLAARVPGLPALVDVVRTEEKGSDVNLAVHLVNDAWQNVFDVALVISNDSDLAEGIRLARARGMPVGVANPSPDTDIRMNFKLYGAASFHRRIEEKHLKKCQFPDTIEGTTITKPAGW